mgnify:FL=1
MYYNLNEIKGFFNNNILNLEDNIKCYDLNNKNNSRFNLIGNDGVFKCIFIDFYTCKGFYKNSFMFEYWTFNNLFKHKHFNPEDYLTFIKTYKSRKFNFNRNISKIYFENLIYKYGFQADNYDKIRYESCEINQFFNFLLTTYENYYIINLEEILFNINNLKDCITNEKNNINLKILNRLEEDRQKKIIENAFDHTKTVKNFKKQVCYIIKDFNTNIYKIGKSIDPKKREKTLQSEKPTLKIIKIFKEDHEYELHKKYKRERIRGEWFKLSNLQIKYICEKYK